MLAPAHAAPKVKAWLFEQKHQIYGTCNNYVSKDFFRGDNVREGTTFVRRKDDQTFYCFNRKKNVYYQGDGKSTAKRISLMAMVGRSGNEGLDWTKAKWKYLGTERLCGMVTKRYVHKGERTWLVWIAELPGVPKTLYKDFLLWTSSPDIGGMPVKMVVITPGKKGSGKLASLDTTAIKTVMVDPDSMSIPRGARKIENMFQLSSNRTVQLMESFSEILGD